MDVIIAILICSALVIVAGLIGWVIWKKPNDFPDF